jgi:GMP synthase-like glutamine amidotransferase
VPFEGPARIESWAKLRGYELKLLRADLCDALPGPSGADMLVVMGGPMSVNDSFPWLHREAAFVESWLKLNKPMLGVCLGAQMLAKVLGANVYTSGLQEIGWWPVTRLEVPAATMAPPLPLRFTPLHWHGETFDMPNGAIRLARSEPIANQAFVAHGNAIGLQFHIEATPESVEAIVEGARADLGPGQWQQPVEGILAERLERSHKLESTCYGVLDWLIAGFTR